jgi:hypothetical protein
MIIIRAIQIGRVPAFLYDDVPWIPYMNSSISIDYYGFQAGLNDTTHTLSQLIHRFKSTTDEAYTILNQHVADIRIFFTYTGVMRQIELFFVDPFGVSSEAQPVSSLSQSTHLRCMKHPKPEHEILRRR